MRFFLKRKAMLEAMPGQVVQLAGFEKGFTGNAADVEARAAQGRALIDAGDFHAELRRTDGRDIPARTGADHDQVEMLGHGAPPSGQW
jgi:hypothetical protein